MVPNTLVRNMDLDVPMAADARRLEVVADGLPLRGGVQLAVDTTRVSALRGGGNPTKSVHTRWCGLDRDRGGPRRMFTPNWSGLERGPAWWSWHWSLEADGPRRQLTSCPISQKPMPAVNRSWCANAWSKRGGCDGHFLGLCSGLLRCFPLGLHGGRGADGFGHRFAGLSGLLCVRLWRGHNEC